MFLTMEKIVPYLQLIDDEDRGTSCTVRYRTMSVRKWTVASFRV